MNNFPPQAIVAPVQPKFIGKSMTIWGAAIALATTAYQVLGPILSAVGVTAPVTPGEIEVVKSSGELILTGAGALIGLGLTVWGRIRAGRNAQPVSFVPAAAPVDVKVVPADGVGLGSQQAKSPKRSG